MVSISNTGKSITIGFSNEEVADLQQRCGESWKWQIPEFRIDDAGEGILTLRADQFYGRKLGRMSSSPGRWMLVLSPTSFPLMPLFSKVMVELKRGNDDATSIIALPKELPALTGARMAALAPSTRKHPPKAVPVKQEVLPMPATNLTIEIEGRKFSFDVPLEQRIRLLSQFGN